MSTYRGRRHESSRPVATGPRGVLRLPTGFRREHLNHFRALLQDFLHTSHDVLRLKWLAVVLADVALGHDARLVPQVGRELTAMVVLGADCSSARAEVCH